MKQRVLMKLSVLLLLQATLISCAGNPVPSPAPAPTASQAAAIAPTAAPAATATTAAALKEEIIVADALPSVTLDPHKDGFSQADEQILGTIHDKLVAYKDGVPGNELVGRLATEWKVSNDGLVWTFKLREGVVWQGGYGPFTANDVVYTYDRLRDPKRSLNSGLVTTVKSVKAVDNATVEFTLTTQNADFLLGILGAFRTGTILSKAAVEKIGDADYALKPVGTGPYQLVERTVGQRTVLERNPNYWSKQPEVKRFVILDIPEESVRRDALEAGKIDIGSFRQPNNIKALSDKKILRVDITYDRPALWTLWISDTKVPDVRVREAIARAINKKELAETVLAFRSNPKVTSYNTRGLVGFPQEKTDELYPYDLAKSKQLLADAGIKPGELSLKYVTRQDFLEVSQAIKGYLEAIGIKTELDVQEQAVFRNSIRSQGKSFDITNVFPSRATTNEMLAYYGAEGVSNQYEAGIPPKVAALYQQQSQELDLKKREALVREMMAIVEKDIPWVVFGYAASAATVHPPSISGPFVNLVSEFTLGFEYIKVDQAAYAQWLKAK